MRRLLFLLLFFLTLGAAAQTRTGTVTDAGGKGIPAVTVQVKGTGIATTTDSLGHFRINAGDGAVLSFSSIGYGFREIPVGGRAALDVVLVTDTRNLNEVLVTALGI